MNSKERSEELAKGFTVLGELIAKFLQMTVEVLPKQETVKPAVEQNYAMSITEIKEVAESILAEEKARDVQAIDKDFVDTSPVGRHASPEHNLKLIAELAGRVLEGHKEFRDMVNRTMDAHRKIHTDEQATAISDFIERNKGKRLVVDGNTIRAVEPTIEQEIEAGLVYNETNNCYYPLTKVGGKIKKECKPCTRIHLPGDKYDKLWATGLVVKLNNGKNVSYWNDIPVYPGGPDIHYCTD